jgi:cyanophycin synthetase
MGKMTLDKNITKMILNDNKIEISKGFFANNIKNALNLIIDNKLKYPLIIKPVDSFMSKGIIRNIKNLSDFKKEINKTKNNILFKNENFMVEEMFSGKEYRVLVFNSEVISCVEKVPANIVGDGISSIKKLIENFNEKTIRIKIKVDEEIKNKLFEQNLNLNSIIEKDKKIFLRESVVSGDEMYFDKTDIINDDLKKICCKATKMLGLNLAGIDLMSKNITKDDRYVILEVNPRPDYSINEKPLVQGKGVDVSKLLLEYLFPDLKNNF